PSICAAMGTDPSCARVTSKGAPRTGWECSTPSAPNISLVTVHLAPFQGFTDSGAARINRDQPNELTLARSGHAPRPRGAAVQSPSPHLGPVVSCRLTVGHVILVHHAANSLELLSRGRIHRDRRSDRDRRIARDHGWKDSPSASTTDPIEGRRTREPR